VAAVAVFCVFFGGRHHTANWYAALLLGVLPGFVDNSQQLRQYALLTFSFTLSLMFAWRVVQTPRNGAALIGLSGVLAVAACTHLISSFFMLALAVVTLWSLRRQPWGRIVQVAVAFVPPALLAFFFKWVFLTQTDKSPDLWWMPPVSLDLLKDVFGEITGWGTLEDVADACNGYVVGCGPVFLAVAAVGIAFLVWTAWGRAAARVPRVLLTMALIYWALVIIYSLTVIQVVVPRTMLPGILPLLLGLGLGVSTHPRWHRRVIAGAVTTLLAVAIAIPWLSGLAVRPFDNLRGASYALKRNSHPPDLLVLVGEDWALEPYWPEYKERRVLRLELAAPLPDTLASLGAARAAQPSGSAVLLFYRHDSLSGARDHAVLDTIIEQLSADGATPENLWGGDYSILRFRPQLHS
jgi:hypothetical protein